MRRTLLGLASASLLVSIVAYLSSFYTPDISQQVFGAIMLIALIIAGLVGGLVSGGSPGERVAIAVAACVPAYPIIHVAVEHFHLDVIPLGIYLMIYNPMVILGSILSWSVERIREWRSAGYPGAREERLQGFAAGLAVMMMFLGIAQLANLTPNIGLAILLCNIFAFAAGFFAGTRHGGKPFERTLIAIVSVMVPLSFAALPPGPLVFKPSPLGIVSYGVAAGLGALISIQ